MYAAAGGASLASRQARQKQRQNKQKQKLNNKATDLVAKTPQQKHFQNYTDNAIPRLSRVERGALKPPTLSQHERRHSASNYHLKEPPKRGGIRESPSICIPVQKELQLPHTHSNLIQQHNHLPLQSTPSLQSQLPQITIPEGDGKLERRCSFVRQVEEMEKGQEQGILDKCNHICNFEIKKEAWEGSNFYTEYEKDFFGSLDYPFSECSQGRAAWQERERGRRCSLSEEARQHRLKQTEAHHRWMKRNRIHDCTYGPGSVSSSDFGLGAYHQSAAANALLYVGLGATAIGSVIFFVGTGEKGFKTLELRLIGPTLIACGLVCCLVRVLLCAIPSSRCCQRNKQATRLKKDVCPHSSSRYPLTPNCREPKDVDFVKMERTSLLNKSKKKVSIVPPNHSLPSTSTSEAKDFHEATKVPLHDAAPTSSTRHPAPILVAPVMSIPEIQLPAASSGSSIQRVDSIIELQPMDLYDARSISSSDESAGAADDHATTVDGRLDCGDAVGREETCLSVVIERNDNSDGSDTQVVVMTDHTTQQQVHSGDKHSGIVLSPLQLQGQ